MGSDNKKLIERVRDNVASRNAAIKEIYQDQKIKDSIYSFILQNGGTQDDAHDMFTHAIIAFVQQCYSPVFELKHQLGTYLYSIARYAWIKKRKKDSKNLVVELDHTHEDYEPSCEEKIIGNERLGLLRKGLTLLDDKCKEVMTMWASQLKMREIAIRMNYASEQVARKKKHHCLNKLKSILKDI
ncbi:MAG: sigma-70 family RNA polymerase sigma factor [Saprospiraceae bacterium]|nr:sigma-70 family RNA polymerase sigma factor [Bacteroidia bacterium]NNF86796.1 sigma-70 family RNA polymerase sigma factor [Winogradskyella sp.]NNL91548.1 sigma-70 family RNA polymerase sigma factor [Saprospiraceae bacterium]